MGIEFCDVETSYFWQHFECGEVHCSNSIIITNFMYILILSCWYENGFPTYFGLEIS
jgi:hypothetical protein